MSISAEETSDTENNEADFLFLQSAEIAVFLGPLDHALRCIHMGHMSAGLGTGTGSAAGVGEKI